MVKLQYLCTVKNREESIYFNTCINFLKHYGRKESNNKEGY